MKVMISQPMNNKSISKIKEERKNIIEKFKSLHIDVIDSIIEETADPIIYNEYHPALFYIAKSIDFMAQVDAVYFMDGWREARGCRIEHKICEEYGILILDDSFFENNHVAFKSHILSDSGIHIQPCNFDNLKHIPTI